METLLQLDSNLLLLLNYYHSEFWDFAFWITSSTLIWLPLYMMIVYAIVKGQKWQSWITILTVLFLVFACDWISTDIFKYGVQRLRPTHHPDLKGIVKTVFGYRGGSFGFVSSHAANTMGLAVFSSLMFKNRYYSIFILSWSLIVGYSRIYLGVHFPGDVIGGFILGASLGYIIYKLYSMILPKFVRLSYFNKKGLARGIAEQFDRVHVLQIIFTGILIFVCVLIVSKVLLH